MREHQLASPLQARGLKRVNYCEATIHMKSPSQTGPGLSQQTKPLFGPNAQRESTRDRQPLTPSYEGIAFCDAQCSSGPGGKLGPTTGAWEVVAGALSVHRAPVV
jgi:hypothetical protein